MQAKGLVTEVFSDFSYLPTGNTNYAIVGGDITTSARSSGVQLFVVSFNSVSSKSVNISWSGIALGSQNIGVGSKIR